jgi:GntR family transcriptional regulator
VVTVVREEVTATLADPMLAERLDTTLGSPLLKIRRLSLDGEDRPVELFTGYFLPERYQYEISFPNRPRAAAKSK